MAASPTPNPEARTAGESSKAPRSAASSRRWTDDVEIHAGPVVITAARAGTRVNSVRTLEKKRVRQISQYGSGRSHDTTAASANDDTNGATRPAAPMKTATRRSVSKRAGASLNRRTPRAARSASLQFVKKSSTIIRTGQPVLSWRIRCAGSAASRYTHQRLGDVRSSVRVRIAFGGHRTDGVAGGNRRTRPIWAPT